MVRIPSAVRTDQNTDVVGTADENGITPQCDNGRGFSTRLGSFNVEPSQ